MNERSESVAEERFGSITGHHLLLFLLVAAIVVTRAIPAIAPHDPWFDEAMLMANLPLSTLFDVAQPLPFYEQAAPPIYLAVAHGLAIAFPVDTVAALRGLAAIASLAGVGLVYVAVRRFADGPVVLLTIALVGLTPLVVAYAVEIKHYIFEYLACALMLYLSIRLGARITAFNLICFFIGGLVVIAMSYTAPVVLASFGIGLIVQRWSAGEAEHRPRDLIRLAGTLGILAVIALVFHLAHTRPTTELLFAAHSHLYQPRFLQLPPGDWKGFWLWFRYPAVLGLHFELISDGPQWLRGGTALLFAGMILVGVAVTAKRCVLLSVAFVAAAGLVYGLSLVGALPLGGKKHFLFMVPLTGVLAAVGLLETLRWIGRRASLTNTRRLAAIGSTVMCAIFALSGIVRTTTLGDQQVSPLIELILSDKDADAPVWVYGGAQPAMDVLAPESLDQIGVVPRDSRATGWMMHDRGPMRAAIRDLPVLWLVFSHLPDDRDPVTPMLRNAEREIGNCVQVMETRGAALWKCERTP